MNMYGMLKFLPSDGFHDMERPSPNATARVTVTIFLVTDSGRTLYIVTYYIAMTRLREPNLVHFKRTKMIWGIATALLSADGRLRRRTWRGGAAAAHGAVIRRRLDQG